MLLKVKNKRVLALPFLNIFALRYIYEKEKMSVADIDLMMASIVWWAKKAVPGDFEKRWLEYIGSLLEKEESGKFAQRKENFKIHGINWKRFHQIPEGLYERTLQAAY